MHIKNKEGLRDLSLSIMKTILRKIEEESRGSKAKSVTLSVGNVFSSIKGTLSYGTKNKLDHKLSYRVPGAEFSKAFKDGLWDGKNHFLYKRGNVLSFPTGFLKVVKKFLKSNNIKFRTKDIRNRLEFNEKAIEKALVKNKTIKPRKYQIRAVEKALKKSCGIINIPTGTGKTVVINLIITAIDYTVKNKAKHLIVTSGISLLRQLQEQVSEFQGEQVGFIGGGIFDIQRITIASIDTLYKAISYKDYKKRGAKTKSSQENREKRYKVIDLLSETTGLFIDEAHHSPAKTFKHVMFKAKAPMRIGTTATYIRAEDQEGMLLRSVTGGIIYKKSISWMIKKGYLARPTIILMEFSDTEKSVSEIDEIYRSILINRDPNISERDLSQKMNKAKYWNKIYTVEISNNEARNKLLSDVFYEFYKFNLSTVLFVNELFQGQYIYDRAIKLGVKEDDIKFLSGKDSSAIRSPVIKAFKGGKIRSIVSTRILGEGIDFPEANAGIRCGGQIFEGNIIQQVGRVLRKIKPHLARDIDRKVQQNVFWFDLCDLHHSKLSEHSLERINTYEKEELFNVKYVKDIESLRNVISDEISNTKIIKKK